MFVHELKNRLVVHYLPKNSVESDFCTLLRTNVKPWFLKCHLGFLELADEQGVLAGTLETFFLFTLFSTLRLFIYMYTCIKWNCYSLKFLNIDI